MEFQTDYRYTDRQTKARYVWQKYQTTLNGRILDVGSDKCHLKKYLPDNASYIGIGLGGTPDIQIDLEKEDIPFENAHFDCVLCLDVLEHLNNPHHIFDELCRVSKQYVIISLPNCWMAAYSAFTGNHYSENQWTKFYGIPPEPPEDRHKWFFAPDEAEAFVRYRAEKNSFEVKQIDFEGFRGKTVFNSHVIHSVNRISEKLFGISLVPHTRNLSLETLWAVLKKEIR